MADHRRHPSIFLLCVASFIISAYAYQFNVGGRDGWVVKPSEDYNHWSGRLRFLVNDTLFFKYKKGANWVLVVSKDDYEKCNVDKPITKLEDGNSIFKLDRSGHVYFISGNKADCDHGQKLIVVVLAVRTPPKPPAPPGVPPASSPPSSAPTPAGSPGSSSPSSAPTPAGAGPPSSSPPSSAPASSPLSPSAPGSPGPAGANSPPAPPGGSSPPGPAGANPPPAPGSSSARPAFTTPSTVLVSTVFLLVLSVSFGASIISL